MSVRYVAVQWNSHKRIYDALIACGIALFIGAFVGVGKIAFKEREAISNPILLMRAFGVCAFVMLHIVLCIGPLARIDRRFLPLLYNRRHLGVATFCVALIHGFLAIGFYHGFGRVNPFVSLLTSNTNYTSLSAFPFQILGLFGLLIMFLMAATSHDFWQKNLSASTWKRLHMLVYFAYGLIVTHVALGALQTQRSPLLAAMLIGGVVTVAGLHVLTGRREFRRDKGEFEDAGAQWVDVGDVDDIHENRARTVCLANRERIAVFRYDGKISAVTNVCAHQGGPLSEGKVIDGCITCPWHGWQYQPQNGQSPPPFKERITTFEVRVEGRRVLLNPEPLEPGTPVEPARVESALASGRKRELV